MLFIFQTLQLFVKCNTFADYNLKLEENVKFNSTWTAKFSQPMALPKGASFTLCVTMKVHLGMEPESSCFRKVYADQLKDALDKYCKKSDVFESISVRAAERVPIFVKSFNFTLTT